MTQPKGDGRFPTTHWTLIARLQSGDASTARRALDDIVAQYHFPLYCAIRHRGLAHHDAEDTLHDFLAKLLRLEAFAGADAEKGRLRAFLCAALQRFLSNWRRDRAARADDVSLDAPSSGPADEARYRSEHAPSREHGHDTETPEHLFDRQWACELLARVLARLGIAYAGQGKGPLFAILSPVLRRGGSLRGEDTPALAAALGLSEPALRKANERLLRDYRTLLEEEILQTVGSREEVAAEIAHLAAVFR